MIVHFPVRFLSNFFLKFKKVIICDSLLIVESVCTSHVTIFCQDLNVSSTVTFVNVNVVNPLCIQSLVLYVISVQGS